MSMLNLAEPSDLSYRSAVVAWIDVVGTGVVLFNLFFINIVVSGLHSYAGLN